jgi:major membrane immunogen (membrane-anchored lipoprotein)
MRNLIIIAVIVLLVPAFVFANGQKEATMQYEDGIYFAAEEDFSERTGWRYCVTLEIDDGEIVMAEWNGANVAGYEDKVTRSETGKYGMVERGGAIATWAEQAERTEEYLLETQDPTAVTYTSDEGHTDAISGVTIHVVEFFSLAEKALNQGPVGYGIWKDGHFHAEEDSYSERTGWKNTVDLTVISGYIMAAQWNAVHEEGGEDKDTRSKNGTYGMVENGDAMDPWYVQADRAEEYLLETQDPTEISYTDDAGSTDAISGVSIHVREFFQLAEEALQRR